MSGHHIQFLLLIRKFRLLLAVIGLMAFFASVYFLKSNILRYTSKASFYITADRIYNPASAVVQDNIVVTQHSLENKRIEQLIFSTDMIKYLTENYDLYNRYDIDSASYFSQELLSSRIRNNVGLNKVTNDFYQVYVHDRNSEVAAAMANSIVKQLDILNRKYIKNKVSGNLRMYQAFIKESDKMNDEHSKRLQQLLQMLREARLFVNKEGDNDVRMSDMEYSIYKAVNTISEITVQNLNTQTYLLNSLKLIDQANSTTVFMASKALPETKSNRSLLVIYSFGVSLVVLLASVTLLYLIYYYKDELRLVFGTGKPVK